MLPQMHAPVRLPAQGYNIAVGVFRAKRSPNELLGLVVGFMLLGESPRLFAIM